MSAKLLPGASWLKLVSRMGSQKDRSVERRSHTNVILTRFSLSGDWFGGVRGVSTAFFGRRALRDLVVFGVFRSSWLKDVKYDSSTTGGLIRLGGVEAGAIASPPAADLALVRMPCLLGVWRMFLAGDFLASFATLLSLTRSVFSFPGEWIGFPFDFLALFAILSWRTRSR